MKDKPYKKRQWGLGEAGSLGAFIGALLVIAHESYAIYHGHFHGGNPFLHIMLEFLVAGIIGAFTFAALAWGRNRLMGL